MLMWKRDNVVRQFISYRNSWPAEAHPKVALRDPPRRPLVQKGSPMSKMLLFDWLPEVTVRSAAPQTPSGTPG
eukprot:1190618-Prorocentrum_minimum.AAC.2